MCEATQHIHWRAHPRGSRKPCVVGQNREVSEVHVHLLTRASCDRNWSSASLFSLDSGFRNRPEDSVLWERNPEAPREQPVERLPAHSAGNSCSSQCFWEVRTPWRLRCCQPAPALISAQLLVLLCCTDKLQTFTITPVPASSPQLSAPVSAGAPQFAFWEDALP